MLAEAIAAGVQIDEVVGDAPHVGGHRRRDAFGREPVPSGERVSHVLQVVEIRIDALETPKRRRVRDHDRDDRARHRRGIEVPDDLLQRPRAAVLVAVRARLDPHDRPEPASRDDRDRQRDRRSVRRLRHDQRPAHGLPGDALRRPDLDRLSVGR